MQHATMIVFPNCKINLGLHITKKREDGFHDLETVFLPIPITDVLEIIAADKSGFTVTGLPVNTNDNLCLKAYDLLKKDFPQLPEIKMHLHKAIPMGAGLGGGSSDAAFTLQLLNNKFQLGLSIEPILKYALQLGSDCPFFIINKTCFATARGEILEAVNINFNDHKLLLIHPGIHIDTKWAFSMITPKQPEVSIKKIIAQPLETWKNKLTNDFEVSVFEKYPEIKKVKDDLYANGALYASMSGSGSTVFGIFNKEHFINYNNWSNYFYKTIDL